MCVTGPHRHERLVLSSLLGHGLRLFLLKVLVLKFDHLVLILLSCCLDMRFIYQSIVQVLECFNMGENVVVVLRIQAEGVS